MKDKLTPFDEQIEGLDDYESEDLVIDEAETDDEVEDRGRNAFISDLWNRYGFEKAVTRNDRTDALVTAHQMVQKFVDTFSGDRKYQVTFDPSISTAGTDIEGRKIIITPSPVFDATLTPQQAGLILTAMATHEASHPRYGRSTAAAIRRVFGAKRAPNTLSNLLDDVRIERRFAEDYPGYADVFRPMADYVARRSISPQASLDNIVNLAILAVRYERHIEWDTPELVIERDWWKAWTDRWAKEDAPRRHVVAIREALRHIAEVRELRKAIQRGPKMPKMPGMPESESQKRLKKAYRSLNPLQRKALRMASENRNGSEIAATLGLTAHDTKILLRTARATMTEARGGEFSRKTKITKGAYDKISDAAKAMGG